MPLTIDFNKILADLEAAGKELFDNNDEQVKQVALEYFEARKERLLNVSTQYAAGEIDENFVLERLIDEKDLLASEGESFTVKFLKVAQEATNEGIEILTDTITDILNQLANVDPDNLPIDESLTMGEVPE